MALNKKPVLTDSVKAAEAVKANRFIDLSGEYPDAAGDYGYGVTVSDAAKDELVAVDVLGTTIVRSTAAAIAVGDKVSIAAPGDKNVDGGKVLKQAGNAATVGRARTAVPAAGGLLEIFLIPN